MLYGRLRAYAGKNNEVFPFRKTLAAELGKSERTIGNLISELKEHGLIRVIRRGLGRSNKYEFIPHIWQKQTPPEPTGTEPKKPCITDRKDSAPTDRKNSAGHTYIENKSEKKTTTGPGVVVSLADDKQVNECLALVPDDIPQSDSMKRLLKRYIAKQGLEYCLDNIRYVNGVTLRKRSAYKAYLSKALSENYAADKAAEQQTDRQEQHRAFHAAVEADQKAAAELSQALTADEKRKELATAYLDLPEADREAIRAEYFNNARGYIRPKELKYDHETLATRSLGFKMFLEGREPA
jgi:hypothetical protein